MPLAADSVCGGRAQYNGHVDGFLVERLRFVVARVAPHQRSLA